MKSTVEIQAEIDALDTLCTGYDTDQQSINTVLAVGAHDALRWALGLAEESLSERLETE